MCLDRKSQLNECMSGSPSELLKLEKSNETVKTGIIEIKS